MKAALVALAFLALAVSAIALLVPQGQVPYELWLFVYLVLAAVSVYSWRHSQAPAAPTGWLLLGLAAAAFFAVAAGIEAIIFGPKSSIVMLDVLVIPGVVLVACVGAVYAGAKQLLS